MDVRKPVYDFAHRTVFELVRTRDAAVLDELAARPETLTKLWEQVEGGTGALTVGRPEDVGGGWRALVVDMPEPLATAEPWALVVATSEEEVRYFVCERTGDGGRRLNEWRTIGDGVAHIQHGIVTNARPLRSCLAEALGVDGPPAETEQQRAERNFGRNIAFIAAVLLVPFALIMICVWFLLQR